MFSVKEAKHIVDEVIQRGKVVSSPIENSLGKVIAKEIQTPFDFPLFASSAMDGYVIRCEDTQAASQDRPVLLKVVSEVFAGDTPTQSINQGEAIQIMTGGMIPLGAAAVIPQECVTRHDDNSIHIFNPVKRGDHIRSQGEEVKLGDQVINQNEIISPAVTGYLAALGIYEVPIFEIPRISVIPTGSELVKDPRELKAGKIFESNSYALGAALKQMRLEVTIFPPIADRKDHLQSAIQECLKTSDITIISGGVSVGEKDYVREILSDLKVETLFWKVAQKPGKPLYFGRRKNRFIFGLPGNPAASLVCFYEYIRPALLKWLGHSQIWPVTEQAILEESISKKEGRIHFLRAYAEKKDNHIVVTPFSSQESHRMASFAKANCLALFPKEKVRLEKGDPVEIHWLPEGGSI